MQSSLHAIGIVFGVYLDALTFIRLCFSPRAIVAAENLFLCKQLGLYIERKVKPRRATDAIRFTLARLTRLFDWSTALTIVEPDTLVRWHRKGFRLFWKWKSRPRGRPRVPIELRKLIVEIATSNQTWGEERIADELLLKIGIRISPRTVRRYLPKSPLRPADSKQRWMTFVRNHARAIIACEFFVVVTARFQLAPSEFLLRTIDRDSASRVSGFHDSGQRSTHSRDAQIVDRSLQSWTSTFQPRTRNAGREFAQGGASTATALHSEGLPSRSDIYPGRLASRVPVAENCGMKDGIPESECVFAEHRAWRRPRQVCRFSTAKGTALRRGERAPGKETCQSEYFCEYRAIVAVS